MNQTFEQDWKDIVHRCFRCGYCKYTHDFEAFNCPSYKNFRFESFSTGGRMWLIYGILSNQLQWDADIANVLYACTTCGNCMENCRFDKFKDYLIDIIEEARKQAVDRGFCPQNQKTILARTIDKGCFNPYGEPNSTNGELKKKYSLPDQAEWVYFIGCTSNYRQQNLRDATLRFLKKMEVSFTLIDEHCCCSPLMRTGQTDPVREFIDYNISQFNNAKATKIITSCAGCYRTLKKEWRKYSEDMDFEVYHTSELISRFIDEKQLSIKCNDQENVTYHDPCHLGRHMKVYDIPRHVINSIDGIKLVEMPRNKENAWCCGAGGGVKIGYPDWARDISGERLEEAEKTGAHLILSTCPFCKTNLNDANLHYEKGFKVLDLIEFIDSLEYKKV
jgi:heterodisulfide reductase subunit D